ncbi:nuclear transport factor 2 family protein [Sphingomonas oryzagri]
MTLDLQILTDRIAIEERLNLYAHYIDMGQASRVPSEIFTIDADIMLSGIPVIGREALADMLASMMKAMDGTSHNITNVMIDVRGDEAYAYSRIIGWHWLARPGADSFVRRISRPSAPIRTTSVVHVRVGVSANGAA